MKVIDEKFERVGITKLDTKKRVTLGAIFRIFKKAKQFNRAPIETFEAFIGSDGDILLRPRVSIPAKELWAHQNPEILQSIQKGIQDLKEGRFTDVEDVDKFIEEL
ncbi:MAG: hypothetical protein ABIC68_04645 [Candidatus Omnitrophota bacterium]